MKELRVGDRVPEPGPLQEYLSVFPEREVLWDGKRQCWAIYQQNPVVGGRERVELLRREVPRLDAAGEPVRDGLGRALTKWEMVEFDYPFVRQRLREWYEFRHEGAARTASERAKRNEQVTTSRHRGIAGEMAAGIKEIRRWLPTLITGHAGDRVPLVPGGLTK